MRILVTGTEGQVVKSLVAIGSSTDVEVVPLGRPEIDLSALHTLEAPIMALRPDVIISAAAYTAVDKAEGEHALAQAINGDAPGELARIASELDIPILHLSTDYVFAGDKDDLYVEEDLTGPASVYGVTKLSGEHAVAAGTSNHVILRTAWVYSAFGNNFVKTMLRLGQTRDEISVVADQHGCPTYAMEIARALLVIAKRVKNDPDEKLRGIFHLIGQGETTWAGFAEAIFSGATKRGANGVVVNHIPTSEYPTPAKRPVNSRLSGKKLEDVYGLKLDPWPESLDHCLTQLIGKTVA